MATDKRLFTVLFAGGVVVIAAAPHYHRSRPAVRCALPERDYQFRSFSQPRRALSAAPLLIASSVASPSVPAATSPAARPAIKSFQFVENATLRSDHCSLSRMSVLLHSSGQWSVCLLAEQNPLTPPPGPVDIHTTSPREVMTDHWLRNEFHIQVRCYAGYGGSGGGDVLGQPLVIPLRLPPVWVQKQQPRQVYESGSDPRVADFFHLIDRVEIEFAYRQN